MLERKVENKQKIVKFFYNRNESKFGMFKRNVKSYIS